MEDNEFCVEIVTDKTYFIEDTVNISFRFNKKSLKPKYSDWIALYKCSSHRNLEEFVAVETNLTIRSPTKCGLHPVVFYTSQLKSAKCNIEYEFLYGNKFNEICGVSHPIRFIHKNDCFCYPNVSDTNQNYCNNCVSQELVNSLLSRISIVDSQLNDYKLQLDEIMTLNKNLRDQIKTCELNVQKTNLFLDNLFYTNEPVTKDGFNWMEPCSDIDLKMNLIESQECELQDLSNQNAGLKKILDNFNNKVTDKNYMPTDMEPQIIDSIVRIESDFIPEPSTATIVFINNNEGDI